MTDTDKIGTLRELDVKPGDVVVLADDPNQEQFECIAAPPRNTDPYGDHWDFGIALFRDEQVRLISRASPPIDLTAITTPDYNDGNWHVWNGGECPDSIHPASFVEFVWHSFNANKAGLSRNDARAIMWEQVIRFRVVKPYTAPREWWIVGDCEAYASEAEALEAAAMLFGDAKPVHVREVKE